MITIIDYGVGNLGSIQNMLQRIGVPSRVTSIAEEVKKAERIILPGVGAFDAAMTKLGQTEIPDLLRERATKGYPILGICLGAQLLTSKSEEGTLPGLSLIEAHCIKFNASAIAPLKIPHMGWNEVSMLEGHPINKFSYLEMPPRFYFAHSYHMMANEKFVLGSTQHGNSFPSILHDGNILAMQFHPEKSHHYGMQILKNFSDWKP